MRGDAIERRLPAERPAAFRAMPIEERAWRARFWVMARGAGYPEPMAWLLAMSDDPSFGAYAKDTVEGVPDARIEAIHDSLAEGDSVTFWTLDDDPARLNSPSGE